MGEIILIIIFLGFICLAINFALGWLGLIASTFLGIFTLAWYIVKYPLLLIWFIIKLAFKIVIFPFKLIFKPLFKSKTETMA